MDIRIAIPGLPIATPDPFAVSLGGSETAGLQLGRTFARKGHRVTIFCNTAQVSRWQGVQLVPIAGYAEPAARAGDLLLIQRDPQALTLAHKAKAAFLWVHDLAQPSMVPALMAGMPAIDRLVTVSAFHAQQFREVAPALAAEQILTLRNGIDLELVAAGVRGAGERDPYRIVYTSRPERGLEVLLGDVFPRILAEEPRATLHLATYDYPAADAQPYYRHLRTMAEQFGQRVMQHGALGKRDLYRLMATAGLYLYPTPAPVCPEFGETSCITAMEAMACGLPWVSTDAGALPETVADAGVLVPLHGAGHAGDGDVPGRLASAALAVLGDAAHATRLRTAGLDRAAALGWGGVADQLADAAGQIARKIASKPRSVRSIAPAGRHVVATPQPVLQIATPVYGGVHPCFVDSLLATQALLPHHGVRSEWAFLAGDSLVPRARNQLAATCLAQAGATHILWIDGDIAWRPEDVLRLLQFDVDLVCGLYPRKTQHANGPMHRFVFRPLESDDDTAPFDQSTGLLEIAEAGTGFMLTKRTVYERMIEAYPESRISRSSTIEDGCPAAMPWLHNFFPVEVVNGELMPEDYSFCRRWRLLGGKVWADPSIKLTHYGAHTYTGDPMSMFQRATGQAA